MTEWRFLDATFDGGPVWRPADDGKLKAFPLAIGTIELWKQKWGPVLETIEVIEPRYQRPVRAYVYKVQGPDGSTAHFAATEVSYGVWLFFVPDTEADLV